MFDFINRLNANVIKEKPEHGRRNARAVLCALACAFFLTWSEECLAADFWMNGSRGEAIPNGKFFEITGEWLNPFGISFWSGKDSDYTICVAIIKPADRLISSSNGGFGHGYDRRTFHGEFIWKPPSGNKSLPIRVDGIKRTIDIADRSFEFAKSNFFVVIFSPTWEPTITQVHDKLEIPP